ncbi:sodium:phosphate symporter [Fibrobacterales bacterium]|nr:sodium:phosphate symporter [Fibrobacterales bacterium]
MEFLEVSFSMEHIWLYVNMAIFLIGGVGIFLLGMRFLSDGLQAVAGDKLRTLIGMATNNRFFGLGVGVLVTGLIQSSSLTTVLVVSFVDSSLMTLAQAVGVIMGANIGTTVTGWILTVQIDKYGAPIAGIAALVYMICKQEKLKYTALAGIGLGLVFLGMAFMKSSMASVNNLPEFVDLFKAFSASSYLGVLGCAFVGCILTCIVQSSSATIGITMALASQGLIGFEAAAALVLGENVGTTVTAILASLSTGNNARRAAAFHSLFNLCGVFYITLLFKPFLIAVTWICTHFFGIEDLNDPLKVSFGIAAAHSTFNILNTIVFIAPCRVMAQFLESSYATNFLTYIKFLRKENVKDSELSVLLSRLDYKADGSYVKFIEVETRIQQVLLYMGNLVKMSFNALENSLQSTEKNAEKEEIVFNVEKQCDKIKSRLLSVLSGFVGNEETVSLGVQYRIFAYEKIFDSLESLSDYAAQIMKLRLRVFDNKIDLAEYQKNGILTLHREIDIAFGNVIPLLDNPIPIRTKSKLYAEQDERYIKIKNDIRALREKHWTEASQIETNPMVNDAYSNMISSYRKIRDHLRGTSNALFGVDKD